MTTSYNFLVGFTKLGIATNPSSTPTITIRDLTNNSTVVTAQAMSAITGITGGYSYNYSGADNLLLAAVAVTTDTTMDGFTLFLQPEITTPILSVGGRLPAALTAGGNMKSSLMEVISTALTETSTGYLAAALKKLFDVATPIFTSASVNQTGDSYSRLGLPSGASVSADIAGEPAANWAYGTRTITSGGITVNQIWDELTSGHVTVGSFGKLLNDYVDQSIAAVYARLGTPDGASIAADIADVGSNITVVASVAVSASQAATIASGNLAILAGYTFRQTVKSTYAGDLSTFTKLWLAFKAEANIADLDGYVFIEMPTGLIRVNSGTNYATPAHGSLAVTGTAGDWDIGIYLDEVATALLFGLNVNGIAGIKARIGSDDIDIWDSSASTLRDGTVRTLS